MLGIEGTEQMNNFIRRIIDIDKAARELTQEAIERRATTSKAAEDKKTEVSENYISMARKRVDVIRTTEVDSAKKQLNGFCEQCEAISKRMHAEYDTNHSEWVSAIVERVVNGDDLL